MFGSRRIGDNPTLLWLTVALLVLIVAATGATVWLVAEVRKEQDAIDEIVRRGSTEDIERIGTLPGELRWQFVLTLLVLTVLVVAAVMLLFLVWAYLKSQKSLREIQRLALDILSSMDEGVVTTDRAGLVTSVNPMAEQLLRIDAGCIGQPIGNIALGDTNIQSLSEEVLQTRNSVFDRDFQVLQNGHQLQLRADCHLLKDENANIIGTVVHVRNVTERVLLEDRMRRMERFMGLGTLAAGLHHEIKNPLGALALHVQLLEERLEGQADVEVAETLGVLKTEVTRISGVLESFRDFASIEQLNRAETDVQQSVKRTVDLIRPQAEGQGVTVTLDISTAALPLVSVDAARLEQVLLNLAMNGLEAMSDGGRLAIAVGCDEDKVTITVSDTGRGIPQHVRSRIFDPYFTTKSDGSGMGLAVCDKIIRQHGGTIDCETSSGGTVFRIVLPLGSDEPAVESAKCPS